MDTPLYNYSYSYVAITLDYVIGFANRGLIHAHMILRNFVEVS